MSLCMGVSCPDPFNFSIASTYLGFGMVLFDLALLGGSETYKSDKSTSKLLIVPWRLPMYTYKLLLPSVAAFSLSLSCVVRVRN